MSDIFLLTKTPKSLRTRICLKLIERSEKANLYLAGDGVYNLLGNSTEIKPAVKVFACKEDVNARGLRVGSQAVILEDFYDRLIEEVMKDNNKVYSF